MTRTDDWSDGWNEGREQAIRDAIEVTVAEMRVNGWDDTTIACTIQPMRALLTEGSVSE